MIRLILYVLLVAAAVIVAVWFANDPGVVSIAWRGWQLDTSVGILIVLVGLLVLAVLLVVKVFAVVRGSARAFSESRRERKIARGIGALADGFGALYAGDGESARKAAREARALLDDNPATMLLSARAARRNGEQNADTIAMTLLDRTGTELAGLRELAENAVAKGDTSGARTYAQRALARKDAPAWALDLLLDVEITAGNWSAALATLDGKTARNLFPAEKLSRLKARMATALAEQCLRDGDAPGASDAARRAVDAGGGV
ncbi:MAG: hypothetical protein KDE14_09735, partial [Rhodobacteraceae bacterium]|nr:hypothetical protein [Paracoccaceae bacterium]